METYPSKIERYAIAARVRSLIDGQDDGDLAVTAQRLGVSELALRMTLDPDAPEPTLSVLLAVVEAYGVDPMFLITGRYDSATHRRTLEDSRRSTADTLHRIGFPMSPGESVDRPMTLDD